MTSVSVVGDEVGRRVGQQLGGHARARGARSRSRTATPTSSSAAAVGRASSSRPLEQRADDLAADGPGAEHARRAAARALMAERRGRVAASRRMVADGRRDRASGGDRSSAVGYTREP